MGKRKSSKKPQGPRKADPLPSNFSCLFCNTENGITVKLDKRAGVGNLSCKHCGQKFQSSINYLSAAVDVYSDWVDACDLVAMQGGAGSAAHSKSAARESEGEGGDDGIIDDEEEDAAYGEDI